MKQMHIPEDMLVTIDYSDRHVPEPAREFKPAVYKEGNSFCALLGENPQLGIFGSGKYIQDTLSARKKDVS